MNTIISYGGGSPQTTLALCQLTQASEPARNSKFQFSQIQSSDVSALSEAGIPDSKIDSCARLLFFLREAPKAWGKNIWRATQQWYQQNVFFGQRSRQYVGECLRILAEVGVIAFRKRWGFTRQMDVIYLGWPWERDGEECPNDSVSGDGCVESERSNPCSGPNAALGHLNESDLSFNCNDADNNLYIQETFHTPSQKLPGEKKENNEDSENAYQDRHSQQAIFIENGADLGEHQDFSSDKNSAGGVSTLAVNRRNVTLSSNHRPPVFTSHQELQLSDRNFLLSVARAWVRENRSVISRAETEAAQISIVKSHFLNKPWKIAVEWESYILGRVSTVCDNIGLGALGLEEIEPYLPSIAIDMQSETPFATPQMLSLTQEYFHRHQLSQHQSVASLGGSADDFSGSDVAVEPFAGVAGSASSDRDASDNYRPPASKLQVMCESAVGRSIIANQIASHPEWGYRLVDGQVVVSGLDDPEAEADSSPPEPSSPVTDNSFPSDSSPPEPSSLASSGFSALSRFGVAHQVISETKARIQIADPDLTSPHHWRGTLLAEAWVHFLSDSVYPELLETKAYQQFGVLTAHHLSVDAWDLLSFIDWDRWPSEDVILRARADRDVERGL